MPQRETSRQLHGEAFPKLCGEIQKVSPEKERPQSRLFSAQAPGPRASPQEPHGPAARDGSEGAPLRVDTAKTDSCASSFLLWHFGHSAFCLPKIRASNSCWHSLQTYSKMGMKKTPRRKFLLFY